VAASGSGYQKFVGVEVELERPSSEDIPVLMDATVSQNDGYRFVYLLPFSPTRWLIEDTYFSAHPALDASEPRRRIAEYLDERGWKVASLLREEQGVLPMPWRGPPVQVDARGPILGGYQGGWFHPATGYSAPIAIRWAESTSLSRIPPRSALECL
jgi:lycopene beta-cyclase